MTKKFHAVIFDLDGTLLDTLDDLTDSMNAVLTIEGFPIHTPDEYKYFVGEGLRVLTIRALPPERRDDATVQRCADAMRREYAQRFMNKTRPYPGIEELLSRLQERTIKMAVLSNKPHAFTTDLIARLLDQWPLYPVLGEGPECPRKPDPTGALKVSRSMGIDPSQTLYLGDTATDMITAKAAGMFPVGVLWGFRTRHELQESGAGRIITAPLDLLEIVDGND